MSPLPGIKWYLMPLLLLYLVVALCCAIAMGPELLALGIVEEEEWRKKNKNLR